MTDTTADAARLLSPRDEARVSFALTAAQLADRILELMPVEPDAAPGELLRRTLALQDRIDHLHLRAVVAERERGTTWSQIAAAAGTTKQSAHERWAGHVAAWAHTGRSALPTKSALDVAATLDQRYARMVDAERTDAVTSGLDAVRFPGSDVYERSQRERADALHARVAVLKEECAPLLAEFKRLKAEGPRCNPARVDNLTATAAIEDEIADLYEQLSGAEPALSDEHRGNVERYRQYAANNREYAALLTPEDETAQPQ